MSPRPTSATHDQPARLRDRLAAGLAGRARLVAAHAARRMLVIAGRNDGPPDLDELWRDFNRKLGGLFGGKGGGRAAPTPRWRRRAARSSPT